MTAARLESCVASRTAELEFANRELEGFSRTAFHHLRSPLRGTSGFRHLIREDSGPAIDEVTRERLSKIEAATRR